MKTIIMTALTVMMLATSASAKVYAFIQTINLSTTTVYGNVKTQTSSKETIRIKDDGSATVAVLTKRTEMTTHEDTNHTTTEMYDDLAPTIHYTKITTELCEQFDLSGTGYCMSALPADPNDVSQEQTWCDFDDYGIADCYSHNTGDHTLAEPDVGFPMGPNGLEVGSPADAGVITSDAPISSKYK